MKNKVIDYVTPKEACKIIGISESSAAQITRWIQDGKIKNTKRFGNNTAIPVAWVKSECLERGISWQGVKLKEGEKGVSLDDYEPINARFKDDERKRSRTYDRMRHEKFEGDHIKFGNAFGLPK